MNIVKIITWGVKQRYYSLKVHCCLLITYSHMGILFPKYGSLVTGGAIGDGLFFSVPVLLYLWEDKTVFRIGIKDELTEFIPLS